MSTLTVKQDGSAQYTSIGAACTAAVDGDIVEIQDSNTYLENILLTKAGGWTKPLEIRGQTGQTPIMDGSTSGSNAAFRSGGGVNTAYHPILKNITFQNYDNGGGALGGVIYFSNVPIEVIDCTFLNCNTTCVNTIRGSASQQAVVLRCKAYGCGKMVYGDTDYVTVTNCVSVPDSGNGSIELYGANSAAYHCSVYATGSVTALAVYTGVITNCVAKQSSSGGTGLRAGTINNSCANGFSTNFNGTQNSCISTDPLYTNPGANDLTLQAGSPCLDAGANAGITTDALGVARPNGSGYDIGAYEKVTNAAISSVAATSTTNVRVTLSIGVAETASMTTIGNYTFTQNNPASGVNLTISAITPQAGGTPTYIDLTVNEQTHSQSYNLAIAGVTYVTNGNASFNGQGDPPDMSIVVQGPTSLRVNYDEGMYNGDGSVGTLGNYTIAGVVIASVVPEGVGSPTYATLSLSTQLVAGQTYTLQTQNLKDTALNPLTPSTEDFQGPAATVSSITVLSPTSVRVNFSNPVPVSASLTTTGNYALSYQAGASPYVVPTISAAGGTGDPTSVVTLTTTEHTQGKTYRITVSGVTNITNGFANYTGTGAAPTFTAEKETQTQILVHFSEDMMDPYEGNLVDAENWDLEIRDESGTFMFGVVSVEAYTPRDLRVVLLQALKTGATHTLVFTEDAGPAYDLFYNPITQTETEFTPALVVYGHFFRTTAQAYVSATLGDIGDEVPVTVVSDEELHLELPAAAIGTVRYVTVVCGNRASGAVRYVYV